jgi:isopenicillin-N N-acyltransferase-like protein
MIVLAVLLVAAFSTNPSSLPQCGGVANTNPILTDSPSLVRSVTNGHLYTVGAPLVSPEVMVLHVYGTPYEMGYAHGQLLAKEMNILLPSVLEWIEGQIEQAIDVLPVVIQQIIAEYGLDAALDFTYYATRDYTPAHWFEELQGLADGSGYDYNDILRIHMFPELIKASCSMFGAWGPAVADTNGETLLQLRALDWATNGPFQQFPVVLVEHPSSGNGTDFAIVTWAGFVGGLAGMSSSPVAICEKVWDGFNGHENIFGYPFDFLLRDILQFDVDTDSALQRIADATRTCAIFIGLGDYTNEFKIVEYAYENITILDDRNFQPYPGHPTFDSLIYINRDVQPSSNPCMGELLTMFYGNITAYNTITYISPIEQTGSMYSVVYDFANMFMYVSNASPYINGASLNAYERPYIRLDMNALFALPNQAPSLD